MQKIITLLNPQLVIQRHDYLGSGIPYMPIMLAYVAGELEKNYQLNVIDAFGENPRRIEIQQEYLVQGIGLSELRHKLAPETGCIIIYLNSVMANFMVLKIIREMKSCLSQVPIVLIENTQSVIGYSLKYNVQEFFTAGADYLVIGDAEQRIGKLVGILESGELRGLPEIDGLIYRGADQEIIHQPLQAYSNQLDRIAFPAWKYFPLQDYWRLGYAHGPMTARYLAMLTSRGCPYKCNFCVVPASNDGKWRARSPENVVAEIQFMIKQYGVKEFHWEDLNPTTSERRMLDICRLITEKDLKLKWKLASGSKLETMKTSTLDSMHRAGCDYVSFSPETGSPKVLRLMNKTFDYSHALEMTRHMRKLKIITQACFVLGYPGETQDDLEETRKYLKELVKAGIDEAAFFIMTPLPGTKTFGSLTGYKEFSELSFSPAWRSDYKQLDAYRKKLYRYLLWWKLRYNPGSLWRQLLNLILRKFTSKAEMNIYRLHRIRQMVRRAVKGEVH